MIVGGKRTSIRLEPDFWRALDDIADTMGCSVSEVVGVARRLVPGGTRTSAVGVYVLRWFRREITRRETDRRVG